MDDDRAGRLLAAPRGRRTLAELLDEPLSVHASGGEDVRWRDEVHRRVAATDPAAIVEQGRLLAALTASVDWAVYWQEPHGEDRVLADDSVAAELAPIAAAVARAPASQWWTEPLTVEDQHAVSWPDSDGLISTPRTSGARVGLAAWREETLADEVRARRERPADPRANWSGVWWSVPNPAGLVVTRRLPAGLQLVEDSLGWESARSWPVSPPAQTARVLEVTGPGAWVALVERFPLDVTASRRHDWWRATGRDSAWAIPDWTAVAEEFDAVHLTVDGYLATAGRALPVRTPDGPAGTVLAGWDPGATWWLTDALPGLGEPTDWRGDRDAPGGWVPVG